MSGSLAKYERPKGNGGKCSSTLEKKKTFEKPVPKSGAF